MQNLADYLDSVSEITFEHKRNIIELFTLCSDIPHSLQLGKVDHYCIMVHEEAFWQSAIIGSM